MVWAGARLPDSTCWMMDPTASRAMASLPGLTVERGRHHVGRFLHVIEADNANIIRHGNAAFAQFTQHAPRQPSHFKANTASNCRPLSSMVSTRDQTVGAPSLGFR